MLSSKTASLCALPIGMFYLATIRDGHDWGDDFSMYIRHAQNLARGEPYAETGYIYNPQNPAVGREIGASHVITGPDPDPFNGDAVYLQRFVSHFRNDSSWRTVTWPSIE